MKIKLFPQILNVIFLSRRQSASLPPFAGLGTSTKTCMSKFKESSGGGMQTAVCGLCYFGIQFSLWCARRQVQSTRRLAMQSVGYLR